jgi:capsular polysaccharide transport system permease protein
MRNTESPPKPEMLARPHEWLKRLPALVSLRGRLPQATERLPTLATVRRLQIMLPKLVTATGGGGRGKRTVLVFIPTILAILYFGLIATERYVAEAKFIVRTAAKPNGLTGLGSLLRMTGLTNSQDQVFAVQDFMTSRDAVKQLEDKLPLAEFYGRPEADFVARYPSLFYGPSLERFNDYLHWMINISYTSTTGITTIRVQAFRPEDAQAVALALLDLGEQLVNRMNVRIYNDAVSVAADEVRRNEQRLIAAEVELTNFRNKETMIDPGKSSVIITELIASLDADLAQTKAQFTELSSSSPNSPQIGVLRGHIAALQAQIQQERAQISDESTGLAQKLADYERLVLEREFAERVLASASTRLDAARVEAQRQQLYLERVVEPNKADYAMMPERLRMIATAFGLNILGILVLWLIFSGIGEHAAVRE